MTEQIRKIIRTPEILAATVREVMMTRSDIAEADAIQTLHAIDQVWDHLFPAEQARIAHLLIDRIVVRKDGISIEWKTNGMPKLLRDSMTQANLKEAA